MGSAMKAHNIRVTAQAARDKATATEAAAYLSQFDKPFALAALALLMSDISDNAQAPRSGRAAITDAFLLLVK